MEERPVEPPKKSAKPACCGDSRKQAESAKEQQSEQQAGAQVEPSEEPCCGS